LPCGQRRSKAESENDFRQPGNITENRQSDSLKQESTSTYLSQGMMKKGDDEDDEVRTTSKPQVRVGVR
jgi:hypothetical protein